MKFVVESFSYPFRGNGVSMLITGAVLIVLSFIAGFGGIFGLVASLFFAGYFCATYFSIVETSAVGHSEAPMFPDVSNVMEDLVLPYLKTLIVALISFLPAFAYVAITGKRDVIYEFLLIVGIIYLPMATMAMIVLGNLAAASPLNVIPSIVRAGGLYWIVVVLLIIVYGLQRVLEDVLSNLFIIGPLIMGLIGMYVLMVSARLLGNLYKDKSEELGWM